MVTSALQCSWLEELSRGLTFAMWSDAAAVDTIPTVRVLTVVFGGDGVALVRESHAMGVVERAACANARGPGTRLDGDRRRRQRAIQTQRPSIMAVKTISMATKIKDKPSKHTQYKTIQHVMLLMVLELFVMMVLEVIR